MTKHPSAAILRGWKRLLQDIELAKRYDQPYALEMPGAARNPILDYLLPSLLYVRLVSILDEALIAFIEKRKLTVPRRYTGSLKGRLDFLDSLNIMKETPKLQDIREKRNGIAHEARKYATWDELDSSLDKIESALQDLGFVGSRPTYEFYAERSGAKDSTERGVLGTLDYCYGLKEGNEKVIEVSWTVKVPSASR